MTLRFVMDYLRLLTNLRKDLILSNEDFPSVKFFRKDIVSVWVWFIVLENFFDGKKDISSEEILREIPNQYSSRPTIFNIINDGVEKKFFYKTKNEKDSRKYIIQPTEQCVNEFKKWALIFKGF